MPPLPDFFFMDVGLELEFSYLHYKHFANEAVSSVPGPGINPLTGKLLDALGPQASCLCSGKLDSCRH